MTTLSSDVFDLFLSRVNDYRLNTLYQSSGSFVFNTYLEPWLLDSIMDFDVCDQSLNYNATSGSSEGYFDETLSQTNKLVLSRLMIKSWMHKEIQDITQMNIFIQDHDYKTHSAAQNLKAKQDYLNVKQEEISQMLIDYSYKRNDWSNWENQLFNAGV